MFDEENKLIMTKVYTLIRNYTVHFNSQINKNFTFLVYVKLTWGGGIK